MNDAGKAVSTEEGRKKMGQHLRRLRKRHGWNQDELEEKSGVSVPTIRAIENNYPPERQRSKSTLKALSGAFGLPADYLDEYQLNPPEEDPLNREFEDLHPVGPGIYEERLTQIIDARLNEIVVPRLNEIHEQIRRLVDAYSAGNAVEVAGDAVEVAEVEVKDRDE